MIARARQFAPLKEGANPAGENLPVLKGIVFDVDGTLWSVPFRFRLNDMSYAAMLQSKLKKPQRWE